MASVINDRELPVAFLDGRYILGTLFDGDHTSTNG
jgi:hypothetical protein